MGIYFAACIIIRSAVRGKRTVEFNVTATW